MLLPLIQNLQVSAQGIRYTRKILSSRRVSVRGESLIDGGATVTIEGLSSKRVSLRGGSYKDE